ncbi:MAG: TIGR03617 family F420-dependent LLM class oxidoreductase [Acidimicrobiia bacterium]
MKIDATVSHDPSETKAGAARIEAQGYDGVWLGETKHDSFMQMVLAAQATEKVTIGTSIAIAFARTPMTLAYSAYDMQLYSKGRFVLGLGSQVKAHIEKRFGMPWSQPAARMREMVVATKAIFDAWQNGTKLDFRGDFYSHTLMTPFFSPDPLPWGPPPIYLAGVGELMTEVAAEVCEGFFLHPFTTERYMREVTVPALERGRAKSGKSLDGFEICATTFAVCATNEADMAKAMAGTKNQIAFYASTPAYRPVLEAHGWGELQTELNVMTKQGRWSEIGDLITDEMVATFGVVGTPEEVGRGFKARLGDVAGRTGFYAPYSHDPDIWLSVMDAIRS